MVLIVLLEDRELGLDRHRSRVDEEDLLRVLCLALTESQGTVLGVESDTSLVDIPKVSVP